MNRPRFVLLATLLGVAACGGDGPTEPRPAADGETLVIVPGSLLFAAAGESQQLRAIAIDADGDSTEVSATYASSNPAVVSIADAGVATGGAALGSAQIVARSGDLVSAPVLALRATPAAGALLVADSQVVGTIEAVDPSASYGPGWRYRVRLRGVSPAVGQVVLASGGAPVGGRVTSMSGAGNDVSVVLELIPVAEMFIDLTFSERLSLEHTGLAVAPAVGGFRVERRPGGGIRLQARNGKTRYAAGAARPSNSAGAIEQEFDLGPFSCKAEVPPGFVFPLSLDVYNFELDPSLSFDIAFAAGVFQRALVTGGVSPRITASPRLTAALEAKAECKVQVATLHLPVGGPLALVIGGQVPLGVGFEIGGKTTFGELGFDALMQSSISTTFGLDCDAGCKVVTALTTTAPGSYFKPVFPSLTDVRFEVGVSGFGWAELAIGNAFLEALQFKAVELKAGLEQKFELAGREAQALDAAYASSFALEPVIEAKAAADLTAIANLLSIDLATLAFAPELATLAQSPRGTLTITPASVTAGTGTQVGQLATFSVALTDVSYLGAYALESVEIRWRKTNGATVTLEPGRPGCTEIAAAQDQVSFACQTDFLEAHQGPQTFFAFAKTRIFGVPIPLPLEIGSATVTVGPPATTPGAVRLDGGIIAASGQTFFTTTGFICQDNKDLTVGLVVVPTGSVSSSCTNASVSQAGTPMSAVIASTTTYTLTGASTAFTALTLTGSSNVTVVGEAGVGTPTQIPDAALADGRSVASFHFIVETATTVRLAGQLGVNIPDPSSDAARQTSVIVQRAGLVAFTKSVGRVRDDDPVVPGGPVSATLNLSPGRYEIAVFTEGDARSDFSHAGVTSAGNYSVTLSIGP